MAELAIVGLVLGSLNSIVSVRNAIERILYDVDAYRTQADFLIPFFGKLDSLLIQLEFGKDSGTSALELPLISTSLIGVSKYEEKLRSHRCGID